MGSRKDNPTRRVQPVKLSKIAREIAVALWHSRPRRDNYEADVQEQWLDDCANVAAALGLKSSTVKRAFAALCVDGPPFGKTC